MSEPLLTFEGVALVRGGRLLFSGLSFELPPGAALHVAGPNGSGKSSLIRLAAGLLRAAEGRVQSTQRALSDDSLALDRELPLRKAIGFWSQLSGKSVVEQALERFRLAHLAEIPVRLLSTGQAKRAALARVAGSSAPLWLLDEPLNGLDSDGTECLAAAIAAHRDGGGAVLAASHVPLPGHWARMELEV